MRSPPLVINAWIEECDRTFAIGVGVFLYSDRN